MLLSEWLLSSCKVKAVHFRPASLLHVMISHSCIPSDKNKKLCDNFGKNEQCKCSLPPTWHPMTHLLVVVYNLILVTFEQIHNSISVPPLCSAHFGFTPRVAFVEGFHCIHIRTLYYLYYSKTSELRTLKGLDNFELSSIVM